MALRIGTAEKDSTFLTQGQALKALLDQAPALRPVEILESASASIENANRLQSGDLNFGFMAANWIGRARRGQPPFRAPIDLRIAAPMNAGPLFFITRADSALRTVADLRGQRVVVGPEGSGMTQHAHSIFDALGLTFSEFSPLYLDFATGAEALCRGDADAQLQCPIPNKVMTALSARTDLRVLEFGDTLETVLDAVPFYRRTTMRKGAFRGLAAETDQPAVVNLLMTHARVDEGTVAAVCGAIVAGTDELAKRNALFAGMGELFSPLRARGVAALEFGGVQLHAGAIQAYREKGLLA
jgi:TRAP transporter TAXI family solute receptor